MSFSEFRFIESKKVTISASSKTGVGEDSRTSPDCPWDEIWQAFEQLGHQGKVVYVGSSNFAAWDIATACQEASKRGLTGLSSEQSIYHLNNRMLELEVIPACRHYGLGLIPWSPLGGGLLAGALEKLESGRRTSEESLKEINKNRTKLEQYEARCKQLGIPPAAVALAWLLNNPIVTAPIIGPRTIEQLESTLRATEITLDEATFKKLDEIFPGPGAPGLRLVKVRAAPGTARLIASARW
jgi:aryl-alcohol dehydrogenase-like predicted oxidoreductase